MYFNFFRYHVQDRDYNRDEVASLINNNHYKHHLLAGGSHFYSLGTFAEATFLPSFFAIPALGFAAATIALGSPALIVPTLALAGASIASLSSISSYDDNKDVLYVYRNQYGVEYASHLVKKVKPEHLPDDYYSGREVTKFLNEYHNHELLRSHGKAYYDRIVNDFLAHKYVNAEVPTTSDAWLFEYTGAILDNNGYIEDDSYDEISPAPASARFNFEYEPRSDNNIIESDWYN